MWDLGPELTLPVRISLLAVLIAALSMLYSRRSSVNAARALKMSTSDFEDRRAAMSIYLENCMRWQAGGVDLVGFLCVITNSATNAKAAVVELKVHRQRTDGSTAAPLILPPKDTNPPNRPGVNLQSTLNLSSRSSQSGWLVFELPSNAETAAWIDFYEIVVTDSEKTVTSCKHHLMWTVENAED